MDKTTRTALRAFIVVAVAACGNRRPDEGSGGAPDMSSTTAASTASSVSSAGEGSSASSASGAGVSSASSAASAGVGAGGGSASSAASVGAGGGGNGSSAASAGAGAGGGSASGAASVGAGGGGNGSSAASAGAGPGGGNASSAASAGVGGSSVSTSAGGSGSDVGPCEHEGQPLPQGTPCDGDNPCSAVATCDGLGQCLSGAPPTIDDGDPCTLDACEPLLGITHTACTPVASAVATTIANSTSFLYSGQSPPQKGIVPGTIEVTRAAVIRGHVGKLDGSPLAGSVVSVLGHAEYGTTTTFADGAYTLAVNGGGPLTVAVTMPGFIVAQRSVEVPWNDYVHAEDIALVPYDSAVTSIDLTSLDPVQIAQGSPVSDADGSRQATLLFSAGTTATMTFPGGSSQPLSALNVRATELTVGPRGPEAMPGTLPPTSAYTYAIELSVDEAVASGALRVDFSQPVIVYVENFLGFAPGVVVPTGYYDRALGRWIPSANGRVIQILGITGGVPDLDTDGDGLVDDAVTLAALGITSAEAQTIAARYFIGETLWRVPVTHFTPWDCNWPHGPPPGASGPFGGAASGGGTSAGSPDPKPDDPIDDPCEQPGSIIECQNQILGEEIPVIGTPIHLVYRSSRVPGRTAAFSIHIPLAGAVLPPNLVRIELDIEVAGRSFTESFSCPCAPDAATDFVWDGKDVFGRRPQGESPVLVRVGYVYDAVYLQPTNENAFASYPGFGVSTVPAREQIILWRPWRGTLGIWDARAAEALGGFTLDVHHAYDPTARVLHLGDGRRRSVRDLGLVAHTIAGTGFAGLDPDGTAAIQSRLSNPEGVAVGPDGSIYIADTGNQRICRLDPSGTLTTIAGQGLPIYGSYSGDGGPALQARFLSPHGIAVGPDESIYFTVPYHNRVLRVGRDGMITTVAGDGTYSTTPQDGKSLGDGGPATAAKLSAPSDIAVASDGVLYIADRGHERIRRVGTDGVIQSIAGNGSGAAVYTNDDGQPALMVSLSTPTGVAVQSDGAFLVASSSDPRVRRIGMNGVIGTFAAHLFGGGSSSGDGGPASLATLYGASAVTLGLDGSVFLLEQGSGRVRRVRPDGIISTVAGGGFPGVGGDNDPATGAAFKKPQGIALAPDGSLIVGDTANNRVRRVSPAMVGLSNSTITLPSGDGAEIYVFDAAGKHLATRDARTGAAKWQFTYDAAEMLVSLTDGDGQMTTILRDVTGAPTAIVAPSGQTTTLTLDAKGYLASITDPAAAATTLAYTPGGLLTELTDPLGHAHTFGYDSAGRLVLDQDPAGGAKSLVRAVDASGAHVTVTTALGRTSSYLVADLATGDQSRASTLPGGLGASLHRSASGARFATLPDGTTVSTSLGPDPRFGMQAPIISSEIVTTPKGVTRTIRRTRTATLAAPADPLSLLTLTETLTLNGKLFTTIFDKAAATVTTTTPLGRTTVTTVDAAGRSIEEQVAGLLPLTHAYDAAGKLVSTTRGARTWARAYDTAAQLSTVTNPLLQATSYLRDPVGRVIIETRPDGQSLITSYDKNGNATTLTPPGEPMHGFGFKPMNQLADYTPPTVGMDATTTSWSYDLDHLLTQKTRPDQLVVSYGRDSAGRLASVQLPAGQGALAYSYDATTGQLASVGGPAGLLLAYGHDGAMLTDRSWSGGGLPQASVQRAYDSAFRLASESASAGNAVSFAYDDDGLLTQAGGLVLSRDPSSGRVTGSTLGVVTEALTYDGYGEVSESTVQASGTVLFTTITTRDLLGRIAQLTETIDGQLHTYDYAYDLAGRLMHVLEDGVSVEQYTYDANGSRLSRVGVQGTEVGSYDVQDRLISYGGKEYTFTAAGELSIVTDTATSSATTYTYDALGNLRRVILPSGAIIDYVVDGENHRVWKKLNGAVVKGYVYGDKLRPAAELDATGAVVARFVYASGRNVPDLILKNGVSYRVLTDSRGSPRLIVNSVSGVVAQRIDYDAHGRVLADSNPGFQPFGFAGGMYDPEIGLVRFGARDYDAFTGRWTAKDPRRFEGGDSNLYGYCLGDPINRTDPEGTNTLTWEDIAFGIGAAATAPIWAPPAGILAICGGLLFLGTDSVAPLDPEKEDLCQQKLDECLSKPKQPKWNEKDFGPYKDCGACVRYCRTQGHWPSDKCPEE
jgi:RHS repeat-associated protein